jgi:Ca2+-binding EF-hand superfamily protein
MDGLEEEEFRELFDKADTNDDGVIDEEEAKQINQVKQSLDEIEKLNNENNYDFQWKKEKVSKEIENIKKSLIEQINDDKDNTKTYF